MAGAGSEKPRIEPSTMQLDRLRLSSRNVNLGIYKPSLPETIRKAKTVSVFKNLGYPSQVFIVTDNNICHNEFMYEWNEYLGVIICSNKQAQAFMFIYYLKI